LKEWKLVIIDPYHADDIEEVTESKVKVGDGHRNFVNSIVSESLKGHKPKIPEEIFPMICRSTIYVFKVMSSKVKITRFAVDFHLVAKITTAPRLKIRL